MKQENPQQAEIAYAAGFFDGEGSFGAYLPNGYGYLVYKVSVWQSSLPVLDWLESKFGGSVCARKNAGYGKNSTRSTAEWRITTNGAYKFLKLIRPYLIVRAADADLVLPIWENRANKEKLSILLYQWKNRREIRAAAETECDDTSYFGSDATVRSEGTIEPSEGIRNDISPIKG